MSDECRADPVQRVLRIFADHLEAWLDGDELALEGLGAALQDDDLGEESVQTAILTLRSLAGALPGAGVVTLDEAPGQGAQRVWGPEERESLSPEAWGFLLALRERGSLDSGQFERVLGRLSAIGERPVGVELAREMAVRVAMRSAGRKGNLEYGAGDGELSH